MHSGWQKHLAWPNNWPLASCVILGLSIVLVQAFLTWLVYLGINIPVLHQVNGFILLVFLPGILILRTLRIHNTGVIESIIYSTGLSLALEMGLGAGLNFLLPLFGISRPLTLLPLTTAISLTVIILTALAIMLDRRFIPSSKVPAFGLPRLNAALYLVLLLLLVVLAATTAGNFMQSNVLMFVCIIAIAATVLLAASGRFIGPALYSVTIFIISLCLLYQTTLMTPYLVGPDIYIEHYVYNLVAQSGVWDMSVRQQVNSCLSIVILAPFFTNLLNLNGVWVFKAVYPLLFSLVPVALLSVFRIQFGVNRAFLAAFFFMAMPAFFLELISSCRQQVAELFFAAILLLLVENRLKTWKKFTLFFIFSLAIMLSHYTVGMIYGIFLILLIILVPVIRSATVARAWNSLTGGLGLPVDMRSGINSGALPVKLLAIPVVVSLALAAVLYCLTSTGYISDLLGKLWQEMVNRNINIVSGSPTDIFSSLISGHQPLIQVALGLDFMGASLQGKIFRVLQFATQALIVIGFIRLVLRPASFRVRDEYIALSLASFLALLAMVAIPALANAINPTRWYHIALFTLAPYCILGGEWVFCGIKRLWFKLKRGGRLLSIDTDTPGFRVTFAAVILVPYFLFTSGLVFEATGQMLVDKVDTPYSFALTGHRLNLTLSYRLQDGAAARWLAEKAKPGLPAYQDALTWAMIQLQGFSGELRQFSRDEKPLPPAYLYFSSANTDEGLLAFTRRGSPGQREYLELSALPLLNEGVASGDRVYDNGGAQVVVIE